MLVADTPDRQQNIDMPGREMDLLHRVEDGNAHPK